jgi:hypothetical protein
LENWNTYSIRRLLLVGNQSPLNCLAAKKTTLALTGSFLLGNDDHRTPILHYSHLCHLLPLPNNSKLLRDEYAEFINVFHPGHRLDKWLLVTFAFFDSKYRSPLERMLNCRYARSNPASHSFLQLLLEDVKEKMIQEERFTDSDDSDTYRFSRVILHFGTLEM